MNSSIDDLLRSGEKDPITGEAILLIHRSMLTPDVDQDRDDWDSPDTIANIENIRRSALIKLDKGQYYGIRNPLWITEADGAGIHKIIAGECRWRITEGTPEEVQMLPCIIRKGSAKEMRLDHTAENGSRRGLNLWQTARSIKRDKEEFGLSTEEIIAVQGLTSKSQLSKINAIHKLGERALSMVKAGLFEDVNLVYELKELNDDQLTKLEKRMGKGESIQQAIKALTPKEPKPTKAGSTEPAASVSLTIEMSPAKALAALLDVQTDLEPKALQAALVAAIKALAPEAAAESN